MRLTSKSVNENDNIKLQYMQCYVYFWHTRSQVPNAVKYGNVGKFLRKLLICNSVMF